MLRLPDSTEKACLIVTDGSGNGNRTAHTEDPVFRRNLRQQCGINACFFHSLTVKIPAAHREKAQTCGVGGMKHGTFQPAELHCQIIHDRAQTDCGFRHLSCISKGKMGRKTIACGNSIAGTLQDLFTGAGTSLPRPLILPGVERRDGISVRIQIEDAVHLSCKADGNDIGIPLQQRSDQICKICFDFARILPLIPAVFRGNGGFALDGAGFFQNACINIQQRGADRRCADVDAKTQSCFSCLHGQSFLPR